MEAGLCLIEKAENLVYTGVLMKMIVASDLHANLPALEAFFEYLDAHGLSEEPVYFLGDYVNLGAFPDEVVSRIREFPAKTYLAGNHDRYIINERALDHNPYFGSPDGVVHCRWTRDQLSFDNLSWLRALTVRHKFVQDGYTIDMIHGRHGSDEETLDESALPYTGKVLYVCGHTHVPRNQKVGSSYIFNPGSLGKPLDSDNRASFGIIETGSGSVSFDVVRIPYDIERAVQALEDRAVPWRNGIINSLRTAVYTDEE